VIFQIVFKTFQIKMDKILVSLFQDQQQEIIFVVLVYYWQHKEEGDGISDYLQLNPIKNMTNN
jgi:hypothetical protein